MRKLVGCYILRFKDSGKFYIGSTKDFNGRKGHHLYMLKKNVHKNPKVQECYNNNSNQDNMDWRVFITDDREFAYSMEDKFLKQYKDDPLLLNSSHDARSTISGIARSKEWIEKVSESMKNKYKDPTFAKSQKEKTLLAWSKPGRKEARSGYNNPFAKPVIIDRVLYGSVKEAQKHLSINEKRIRANANNPLMKNVIWFTGNEIEYDRKFNDSFEIDEDKVKRNLLFADKETEYMKSRLSSANASASPITINGKDFGSIKEAAAYFNVSTSTIQKTKSK